MASIPFLHTLLLSVLFLQVTTRLICNATDSITPTQPLRDKQTITSKRGIFELGFFTPSNSSQRHYIGMWYKQVPEQTVVWVANRETPVSNTADSILKITEEGNLALIGPSDVSIWSTNLTSTTSSNSTTAVLLDSGNLVLTDIKDPLVVHWESFAHPTNTFLSGGWLGIKNKTTRENARLTSWKSKEDPAPGPFSHEIDSKPISQNVIMWNGIEKYWNSGVWDGEKLVGVPETQSTHTLFVDNETAKYYTYSMVDDTAFSHPWLDISGQLKARSWLFQSNRWYTHWVQPKSLCDVYAACGAFGSCNELNNSAFCECLPGFKPKVQRDWDLGGWSDGCMRRTPLQAFENSTSGVETDRFLALHHMKLPASSESISVASSATTCRWVCLDKRSCTAYTFESGCMIWHGDLVNLKQFSGGNVDGKTLFLRLAASEVPISRSKKGIIAGIAVSSAVALVAAGAGVLLLIRRRQRQRKIALAEAVAKGCLVAFRYRDLQSLTKNFKEKLGGGGFGSVFKGTLPNLTMVAVKKLEGACQGDKQFRAEVSTIGTIQHVNLIRLRGFCSDSNRKLLVYDYMRNGSLDSHLFRTQKNYLDWSTRYRIAIETARGLAYLHEKCRDCIIHCDVKPENILLDDGFGVKIADFGLAKLFGRDFSHVLTTLRGTIGYLAPEWISGLAITTKADVYSYGMMLFEIISGRRNREKSGKGQATFFPTWAMIKMSEGDVACLLDDRLEGNADMEGVSRACGVAGWCIQDHENERPSMGQVVQMLEGVMEVSVPPMPRLLQVLDENCDMISSFRLSSSRITQIKS